jgi:hypothetical protein
MNNAVGVAGVVHDSGDHTGSRRAGVGPDMLIDAERVHALQPVRGSDATDGFYPDGVPGGVPGDAELVRQGRDRSVEALQRAGRPFRRGGRELRPWSGQRVLFGERKSRAARVRASPDPFGAQQPHRPAETGNVMKPNPSRRTTPQQHRPAPRRRRQPDPTTLICEAPDFLPRRICRLRVTKRDPLPH